MTKLLQPLCEPVLLYRTYQHYKGNMYTVIAECRHSETGNLMIVYKGTHETWCTLRDRFNETVTDLNGNRVLRFTLQDN